MGKRLPIRRVFTHKDVLRVLEEGRKIKGLTMEDVSEIAGAPDRYYNKVVMGLERDSVRDLRRELRGRPKPKGQSTVRFPMKMQAIMAWLAEACGYAIVIMPIEDAARLCDPDPVTHLDYDTTPVSIEEMVEAA